MSEVVGELSESLPSWATCLASLVDQKLLVVLRDGRNLVGFFRSYDQFANILLEVTQERHIVNSRFADIPMGTMIVRGENVAFFGELDEETFCSRITKADLREVLQDEDVQVDLGFLDDHMDVSLMDPSIQSERRQRWESDSAFDRDSSKYKLARIVRRHFNGRTVGLLLLLELILQAVGAHWTLHVAVVLCVSVVGLRLVLVRFAGRQKRNRFIQLVDHQNVLGKRSNSVELSNQAESNV